MDFSKEDDDDSDDDGDKYDFYQLVYLKSATLYYGISGKQCKGLFFFCRYSLDNRLLMLHLKTHKLSFNLWFYIQAIFFHILCVVKMDLHTSFLFPLIT